MKSIQSTIQMDLFTESPVVPQWSNLDEETQVEVVTILARLLAMVQRDAHRVLSGRGANDE